MLRKKQEGKENGEFWESGSIFNRMVRKSIIEKKTLFILAKL